MSVVLVVLKEGSVGDDAEDNDVVKVMRKQSLLSLLHSLRASDRIFLASWATHENYFEDR